MKLWQVVAFLVILWMLGFALAFSATAQGSIPQCAARPQMVAMLGAQFGERVIVSFIASDGAVIEIWGSPETRTATALKVNAAGLACILTSGQSLEVGAREPPGVPG